MECQNQKGWDMKNLNSQELSELYTWIDTICFSRPKKNLARDFSDGVLVAETIASFFPTKVNVNSFFIANSRKNKLINWNHLNDKVFPQFGIKKLKLAALNRLMDAKPGAIEKLLFDIRSKMGEKNPAVTANNTPNSRSTVNISKKTSKPRKKSSRDTPPPYSKIELQLEKYGCEKSLNADETAGDYCLPSKIATCQMSVGCTEIPPIDAFVFNSKDWNGNTLSSTSVSVSYKNESWEKSVGKTLYPFNARWYSYPISDTPGVQILEAVNTNGLV